LEVRNWIDSFPCNSLILMYSDFARYQQEIHIKLLDKLLLEFT
jgi:hypothetical protein